MDATARGYFGSEKLLSGGIFRRVSTADLSAKTKSESSGESGERAGRAGGRGCQGGPPAAAGGRAGRSRGGEGLNA